MWKSNPQPSFKFNATAPRRTLLFSIYTLSLITGSLTTEIIKKLNISIENLPQKCQNLLEQTIENQTLLQLDNLETTSISLYRSKEISNKLQDDYEILKLKQKNAELQAKIDRNNTFLDGLRKELVDSKESLSNRTPNPDNIQEHIRQLKQKLAAYEESYVKAKVIFLNCGGPEVAVNGCAYFILGFFIL